MNQSGQYKHILAGCESNKQPVLQADLVYRKAATMSCSNTCNNAVSPEGNPPNITSATLF